MAQANAGVYGAAGNVRAVCADVRDIGFPGVDAVFIDPARRSGGRRMRAGESEPPLPWCVALAGRGGPGRYQGRARPAPRCECRPDGSWSSSPSGGT